MMVLSGLMSERSYILIQTCPPPKKTLVTNSYDIYAYIIKPQQAQKKITSHFLLAGQHTQCL